MRIALIALPVLLALPCLAQEPVEAPPEELVSLIPSAGAFEGLEVQSDAKYYPHDDLADYINGDAETYYTYGVGHTAAIRYTDGARGMLELSIYDMLTPLGAFGVYAQRRPAEPEYLELGAQGYVSKPQAVFISGRYYVVVKSVSRSADGIEKAKQLAEIIDDVAPGPKELPAELAWFPKDTLKPGTYAHSPSSFLGMADMPALFTAKYEHPTDEDEEVTLGFALYDTDDEMVDALDLMTESLTGRLANDGEVSESGIELGDLQATLTTTPVKYRGNVHVVGVGRSILVATRTEADHATELLKELAKLIEDDGPGLAEE